MNKRRVVGRIYGMKYSWKGHKDRNRHKNRIKKKEWASSAGLCQNHKLQHPHQVKVSVRGTAYNGDNTHPQPCLWLDAHDGQNNFIEDGMTDVLAGVCVRCNLWEEKQHSSKNSGFQFSQTATPLLATIASHHQPHLRMSGNCSFNGSSKQWVQKWQQLHIQSLYR